MKVGIIMGSDSDFPIMKKAVDVLKEFGVEYEVLLASAHRTPAAVRDFASGAEERGISVIIAGAGMAAHLPGVVASFTTLPVIGVPLSFISYGGTSMVVSLTALGLALSVYRAEVKREKREEMLRDAGMPPIAPTSYLRDRGWRK